jgi:hypothetical protein
VLLRESHGNLSGSSTQGTRVSPWALNWRAKPHVSYQVIVDLISVTTTKTGLKVVCGLDDNLYPRGVVSDAQLAAINTARADFHGE